MIGQRTIVDFYCDECSKHIEIPLKQTETFSRGIPGDWHKLQLGDARSVLLKDEYHFCSFECLMDWSKNPFNKGVI